MRTKASAAFDGEEIAYEIDGIASLRSQCWVDGPLTAWDVPSWGREQLPATEIVSVKAITIGLDIAKSVFQVHSEDATTKIVLQKRLRRSQVLTFSPGSSRR